MPLLTNYTDIRFSSSFSDDTKSKTSTSVYTLDHVFSYSSDPIVFTDFSSESSSLDAENRNLSHKSPTQVGNIISTLSFPVETTKTETLFALFKREQEMYSTKEAVLETQSSLSIKANLTSSAANTETLSISTSGGEQLRTTFHNTYKMTLKSSSFTCTNVLSSYSEIKVPLSSRANLKALQTSFSKDISHISETLLGDNIIQISASFQSNTFISNFFLRDLATPTGLSDDTEVLKPSLSEYTSVLDSQDFAYHNTISTSAAADLFSTIPEETGLLESSSTKTSLSFSKLITSVEIITLPTLYYLESADLLTSASLFTDSTPVMSNNSVTETAYSNVDTILLPTYSSSKFSFLISTFARSAYTSFQTNREVLTSSRSESAKTFTHSQIIGLTMTTSVYIGKQEVSHSDSKLSTSPINLTFDTTYSAPDNTILTTSPFSVRFIYSAPDSISSDNYFPSNITKLTVSNTNDITSNPSNDEMAFLSAPIMIDSTISQNIAILPTLYPSYNTITTAFSPQHTGLNGYPLSNLAKLYASSAVHTMNISTSDILHVDHTNLQSFRSPPLVTKFASATSDKIPIQTLYPLGITSSITYSQSSTSLFSTSSRNNPTLVKLPTSVLLPSYTPGITVEFTKSTIVTTRTLSSMHPSVPETSSVTSRPVERGLTAVLSSRNISTFSVDTTQHRFPSSPDTTVSSAYPLTDTGSLTSISTTNTPKSTTLLHRITSNVNTVLHSKVFTSTSVDATVISPPTNRVGFSHQTISPTSSFFISDSILRTNTVRISYLEENLPPPLSSVYYTDLNLFVQNERYLTMASFATEAKQTKSPLDTTTSIAFTTGNVLMTTVDLIDDVLFSTTDIVTTTHSTTHSPVVTRVVSRNQSISPFEEEMAHTSVTEFTPSDYATYKLIPQSTAVLSSISSTDPKTLRTFSLKNITDKISITSDSDDVTYSILYNSVFTTSYPFITTRLPISGEYTVNENTVLTTSSYRHTAVSPMDTTRNSKEITLSSSVNTGFIFASYNNTERASKTFSQTLLQTASSHHIGGSTLEFNTIFPTSTLKDTGSAQTFSYLNSTAYDRPSLPYTSLPIPPPVNSLVIQGSPLSSNEVYQPKSSLKNSDEFIRTSLSDTTEFSKTSLADILPASTATHLEINATFQMSRIVPTQSLSKDIEVLATVVDTALPPISNTTASIRVKLSEAESKISPMSHNIDTTAYYSSHTLVISANTPFTAIRHTNSTMQRKSPSISFTTPDSTKHKTSFLDHTFPIPVPYPASTNLQSSYYTLDITAFSKENNLEYKMQTVNATASADLYTTGLNRYLTNIPLHVKYSSTQVKPLVSSFLSDAPMLITSFYSELSELAPPYSTISTTFKSQNATRVSEMYIPPNSSEASYSSYEISFIFQTYSPVVTASHLAYYTDTVAIEDYTDIQNPSYALFSSVNAPNYTEMLPSSSQQITSSPDSSADAHEDYSTSAVKTATLTISYSTVFVAYPLFDISAPTFSSLLDVPETTSVSDSAYPRLLTSSLGFTTDYDSSVPNTITITTSMEDSTSTINYFEVSTAVNTTMAATGTALLTSFATSYPGKVNLASPLLGTKQHISLKSIVHGKYVSSTDVSLRSSAIIISKLSPIDPDGYSFEVLTIINTQFTLPLSFAQSSSPEITQFEIPSAPLTVPINRIQFSSVSEISQNEYRTLTHFPKDTTVMGVYRQDYTPITHSSSDSLIFTALPSDTITQPLSPVAYYSKDGTMIQTSTSHIALFTDIRFFTKSTLVYIGIAATSSHEDYTVRETSGQDIDMSNTYVIHTKIHDISSVQIRPSPYTYQLTKSVMSVTILSEPYDLETSMEFATSAYTVKAAMSSYEDSSAKIESSFNSEITRTSVLDTTLYNTLPFITTTVLPIPTLSIDPFSESLLSDTTSPEISDFELKMSLDTTITSYTKLVIKSSNVESMALATSASDIDIPSTSILDPKVNKVSRFVNKAISSNSIPSASLSKEPFLLDTRLFASSETGLKMQINSSIGSSVVNKNSPIFSYSIEESKGIVKTNSEDLLFTTTSKPFTLLSTLFTHPDRLKASTLEVSSKDNAMLTLHSTTSTVLGISFVPDDKYLVTSASNNAVPQSQSTTSQAYVVSATSGMTHIFLDTSVLSTTALQMQFHNTSVVDHLLFEISSKKIPNASVPKLSITMATLSTKYSVLEATLLTSIPSAVSNLDIALFTDYTSRTQGVLKSQKDVSSSLTYIQNNTSFTSFISTEYLTNGNLTGLRIPTTLVPVFSSSADIKTLTTFLSVFPGASFSLPDTTSHEEFLATTKFYSGKTLSSSEENLHTNYVLGTNMQAISSFITAVPSSSSNSYEELKISPLLYETGNLATLTGITEFEIFPSNTSEFIITPHIELSLSFSDATFLQSSPLLTNLPSVLPTDRTLLPTQTSITTNATFSQEMSFQRQSASIGIVISSNFTSQSSELLPSYYTLFNTPMLLTKLMTEITSTKFSLETLSVLRSSIENNGFKTKKSTKTSSLIDSAMTSLSDSFPSSPLLNSPDNAMRTTPLPHVFANDSTSSVDLTVVKLPQFGSIILTNPRSPDSILLTNQSFLIPFKYTGSINSETYTKLDSARKASSVAMDSSFESMIDRAEIFSSWSSFSSHVLHTTLESRKVSEHVISTIYNPSSIVHSIRDMDDITLSPSKPSNAVILDTSREAFSPSLSSFITNVDTEHVYPDPASSTTSVQDLTSISIDKLPRYSFSSLPQTNKHLKTHKDSSSLIFESGFNSVSLPHTNFPFPYTFSNTLGPLPYRGVSEVPQSFSTDMVVDTRSFSESPTTSLSPNSILLSSFDIEARTKSHITEGSELFSSVSSDIGTSHSVYVVFTSSSIGGTIQSEIDRMISELSPSSNGIRTSILTQKSDAGDNSTKIALFTGMLSTHPLTSTNLIAPRSASHILSSKAVTSATSYYYASSASVKVIIESRSNASTESGLHGIVYSFFTLPSPSSGITSTTTVHSGMNASGEPLLSNTNPTVLHPQWATKVKSTQSPKQQLNDSVMDDILSISNGSTYLFNSHKNSISSTTKEPLYELPSYTLTMSHSPVSNRRVDPVTSSMSLIYNGSHTVRRTPVSEMNDISHNTYPTLISVIPATVIPTTYSYLSDTITELTLKSQLQTTQLRNTLKRPFTTENSENHTHTLTSAETTQSTFASEHHVSNLYRSRQNSYGSISLSRLPRISVSETVNHIIQTMVSQLPTIFDTATVESFNLDQKSTIVHETIVLSSFKAISTNTIDVMLSSDSLPYPGNSQNAKTINKNMPNTVPRFSKLPFTITESLHIETTDLMSYVPRTVKSSSYVALRNVTPSTNMSINMTSYSQKYARPTTRLHSGSIKTTDLTTVLKNVMEGSTPALSSTESRIYTSSDMTSTAGTYSSTVAMETSSMSTAPSSSSQIYSSMGMQTSSMMSSSMEETTTASLASLDSSDVMSTTSPSLDAQMTSGVTGSSTQAVSSTSSAIAATAAASSSPHDVSSSTSLIEATATSMMYVSSLSAVSSTSETNSAVVNPSKSNSEEITTSLTYSSSSILDANDTATVMASSYQATSVSSMDATTVVTASTSSSRDMSATLSATSSSVDTSNATTGIAATASSMSDTNNKSMALTTSFSASLDAYASSSTVLPAGSSIIHSSAETSTSVNSYQEASTVTSSSVILTSTIDASSATLSSNITATSSGDAAIGATAVASSISHDVSSSTSLMVATATSMMYVSSLSAVSLTSVTNSAVVNPSNSNSEEITTSSSYSSSSILDANDTATVMASSYQATSVSSMDATTVVTASTSSSQDMSATLSATSSSVDTSNATTGIAATASSMSDTTNQSMALTTSLDAYASSSTVLPAGSSIISSSAEASTSVNSYQEASTVTSSSVILTSTIDASSTTLSSNITATSSGDAASTTQLLATSSTSTAAVAASITVTDASSSTTTTINPSSLTVEMTSSEVPTTASSATTAAPDACNGVTCQNNGTCQLNSQRSSGYECLCTSDYVGDSCQNARAVYSAWSAWGSCDVTCGDAVRSRTRSCTDINGADRTTECGTDTLQTEACTGLPQCQVASNPCQTADICTSDGVQHTCLTKGSTFTCECQTGFVNSGQYCVNENECVSQPQTNDCIDMNTGQLKEGVASCRDTVGNYTCTCSSGYQQDTSLRTCTDIDECTTNADDCDTADRATCTNTPGSYTCACLSGFQGDGTSCTEDRLMAFSTNTKLAASAEYSPYLFPDFAVPFGTNLYPSMYFTRSGLLLFTTITDDDVGNGNRKSFTNPSTFSLDSSFQEKAAFAPWWSNMNIQDTTDSTRGIYYKEYKSSVTADTGSLSTVSSEINNTFGFPPTGSMFSGKYMLVLTYNKMGYPSDDSKTVTFQVIFITDYINSYVKVAYADRAMSWNVVAGGVISNYPTRIGYILQTDTTVEYPYSYTSIEDASTTQKDKIENIDNVVVDSVTQVAQMKGSSKGLMFVKLTSHGSSFVHNGVTCKDWIDADILAFPNAIAANAEDLCPGTVNQITDNFVTFSSSRIQSGQTCYLERRAIMSTATNLDTLRCCYDDSNNALLTDHTLTNGMNTYRRQNGTAQLETDQMYTTCCGSSYAYQSAEDLCTSYLNRRPVCTSDSFNASTAGGAVGDPHLATLDQLAFTFNGLGEFILLKDDGKFELQGRFSLVGGTATYISAIAAKQLNATVSDLVEFRLNGTRDGVEIFRNGQLQTVDFGSGSVDWNEVVITKTTDSSASPPYDTYSMIFTEGVTARVRLQYGMFQLLSEATSAWSNQFTGLLGNFNGNQEDDFTSPNGNVLSQGSSATEEDIFTYGMNWQNTNETSLFTYTDGNDWSSYVNASFTPIFFNANLSIMFPNDTIRQLAEDTCYQTNQSDPDPTQRKECYLDFAATGDTNLASGTLTSRTDLQNTQTNLANYPPEVRNGNVTLEVTEGQTYASLVVLDVVDRNGDNITFSLNENVPSGVSIDNTTRVLSWTSVPDISTGLIMVKVSDGTVESIWTPKIELCKCQNGACDFSITSNDPFVIVPCTCNTGYEGTFCSEDIDACLDSPCFEGVQCSDVPASQLGSSANPFICGSCPTGLEGNGIYCADRDECVLDQPCSHNCTNIAGGFTCYCLPGYELGSDSRTCSEIDECSRGTDLCSGLSTTCTNTLGSYTCTCLTGFESDNSFTSCADIDECTTGSASCPANSLCANTVGSYTCNCVHGYTKDAQTNTCNEINECDLPNNCGQICVDGIGTYTCACNTGFTLQNDSTTCSPNTECNSAQRASCDGGNTRSQCALSDTQQVLCICPSGFSKNASDYCIEIDECATQTDICVSSSSTCVNTEGGYYCNCASGYTQVDNFTCTDINECTQNTHNCVSPATCQNYDGGFQCNCPSGYNLNDDGRTCNNTDECAQSTLNNCDDLQGKCTDTPGSYTCSCNAGYTGNGYSCSDLNECGLANKGGCTQGCLNSQGSFSCFCFSGYALNADGTTCDDINECSNDADNNCVDSNHCNNTVGGYTCSCPANFTLKGDGVTCESIFQCDTNHGCSHTCGKINGVDTCQCGQGYQVDASGFNCTDIFECNDTNLHNCNSSNNVLCRNTEGSYVCDCYNSSYVKTGDNLCEDKDECSTATHNCPANSACVNSDPGFSCVCNTGFDLVGSGCQDINECTRGTHSCHATRGACTNTDGGYTCACMTGYRGDGITCTDIDECTEGTHQCDQNADRGVCTNTEGSYTCNCTSNYELAGDGRTCNDIDECITAQDNCEMICNNTVGGYRCSCPDGLTLDSDQRTCIVEVDCDPAFAGNCSYRCAKVNSADTCICQTGYILNTDGTSCIDIDECGSSQPCDSNHGNCTNTQGSYACGCTNGYILGPGNVCNDRNGNWGAWGAWGTCSKTCGNGQQTRTRTCSDPAQAGNGADCAGDSSETQSCSNDACPANDVEATYGILLSYTGITIAQFNTITTSFKQKVKDIVTTYCNYNTTTVQQCCNTSNNFAPDPNNPREYTTTDSIAMSSNYPILNNGTMQVMIVVKYVANNALCTAASGVTSTRRKRSITLSSLEFAIPQEVLSAILSDVTSQNELVTAMVQAIESATGQTLNITMGEISLVTSTQTVTATTEATVTATTSNRTIALAIIGAILGAILIAVLIVIAIKLTKKNKVTPAENVPPQ